MDDMTSEPQQPDDPQQPTEPTPPEPATIPFLWSPYPPAPVPPIPLEAPRRTARGAIAAIVAALVLFTGGIGIGWGLTRRTVANPQVAQAPVTAIPSPNSTRGPELSTQAIADRVAPAVVDIKTYFDASSLGNGNGSGQTQPQGAATGIILTSNGEVLTNNHVVDGSTSIKITIQGRSGTYDATVVGVDPTDDIALIQLHGVIGLPTAQLGDATALKIGERVVAIGNALGRGGTPAVTEGNVTALNQSITAGGGNSGSETLRNLIQSDAPISPGDSGGPLVNGSGQVIGMITAASRTSRFDPESRTGFAIPINDAIDVVNQIRTGQGSDKVIIGSAGFLGVEVANLDAESANQLGLPVSSGALVRGVLAGTPAAQAGITRNSVITAIDGQTIDSVDALGGPIHSHKPGDQIRVTWVDQSGSHTATVTLIAGPAV
jgi:S1-C subfamily serine protease